MNHAIDTLVLSNVDYLIASIINYLDKEFSTSAV